MNKKLFFGMFAAASMLLATSCSNDELNEVQSGNEAKVTFSLGLENGIGSRTIPSLLPLDFLFLGALCCVDAMKTESPKWKCDHFTISHFVLHF